MKTNNVLSTIAALNLEPIKNKLMDAEHGEGWSRAKVEAMDLEYRRFLHLMHTFPNEAASPTKAVDTFWHYHILDTQKYAADCDDVFGCFMHHDPYANEGNTSTGVTGGDRMQELYEATFGETYIRTEAYYLALEIGQANMAEDPHSEVWGNSGRGPSERTLRARIASAKAATSTARCVAFCGMTAKKSATIKVSPVVYLQQNSSVRQSSSYA